MKKICILFLISSILSFAVSACTVQTGNSMVKSQRRFAKYMEPQTSGNVIDLSEGPKQKYDINLGPENLNFDFHIENPY